MNAAKLLGKYGWNPGQGLGKNADGITKAIEVTKKDNTNGVGMREDWSNTFESMFDKLASNIQIGGSSSDEDRNEDDGSAESPPSTVASPTTASISAYGNMFVSASNTTGSRQQLCTVDGSEAMPTFKSMYQKRMSGKLRRIEAADRAVALSLNSNGKPVMAAIDKRVEETKAGKKSTHTAQSKKRDRKCLKTEAAATAVSEAKHRKKKKKKRMKKVESIKKEKKQSKTKAKRQKEKKTER